MPEARAVSVERSALNVEHSGPSRAVFLSYAREDTDAARRIAEALRSHGLEVWFDQSELRGGDQWDAKIRRQINDCSLFLPIISQHTQERGKGYFRLEWKLAVEQTHLMADGMAFLAPVVIDETPEGRALVPPEFLRVQWTRLPGALPTPQFIGQVKRLLGGKPVAGVADPGRRAAEPGSATPAKTKSVPGWAWGAVVAVVIGIGLAFYLSRQPAPTFPTAASASEPQPATASPSPRASSLSPAVAALVAAKSIAVLPFANLSTDKENEFFTDGVHDDVITNLAKIRDLKVISRTSVLAYRDPAARNLKKIAAELGVATVLEGSIRRVGSKVHMNAQLIDARTDEHLWADTFDGDTSDIFALQASLAQKIAAALKATLTPTERSLIERRPTENQEAYGLYLRAKSLEDLLTPRSGLAKYEQAAALYARAIERDPKFLLAYSRLAYLHGIIYWFGGMDPTPARRAQAEAALAATEQLSSTAPETHIARGTLAYFCDNHWERALAEFREAETALPNDASLQALIAFAHRRLGHWTEAVSHLQRAMELNPADFYDGTQLASFYVDLRRFDAAQDLAQRLEQIVPGDSYLRGILVRAQFGREGDRAAYRRALQTMPPADDDPAGLRRDYRYALALGDLAAADRALADSRLTGVDGLSGTLIEPAALHRALVAFLRGDHAAAQRFADEANTWFRQRRFSPRQQPYVTLAIARANAFAGRAKAAPELQAAATLALQRDAYSGRLALTEAGRAYVALGRREEALALLRSMMEGPAWMTPHELRIDPLWSQLQDDPRFEEILKLAKPL